MKSWTDRWIFLSCLSDRPGHHGTLNDGKTPCPGANRCPVCRGRGRVDAMRGEEVEEVECTACRGDGTVGA